MITHSEIFRQLDPPYERFDNSMLGPEFPAELDLVSRLWFRCGYRPGIGAYLNFFLLRDFITTHDTNYPPRFRSFKSMATSFYQTDLFIREVTDSGAQPSGGISNPKVRETLEQIQERHRRVRIPQWMQTYFGFSLLENVEKQCAPLTDEARRLHLSYMSKAYRIMGLPFSERRDLMEQFSRLIEEEQTAITENVPKHSIHILRLGEMIGVPSAPESILPMLPQRTRTAFEPLYPRVRPGLLRRLWSRLLGKLLMPKAVGAPRKAVPLNLLGLVMVLVLGAGCGALPPDSPTSDSAEGGYNLLLVVVDTLRADHLPFHGYIRMTAPNLARFAESAVVFDNAFTVMSHTLPAHVSLLTGTHPAKHHVLANGWLYGGHYPTLAQRLRTRGYATAGFVSGYPLVAASGLDAGFEVYKDTAERPDPAVGKVPGEMTNERALEWLLKQTKPFFAFVHYYDVHPPYDTPPGGQPAFATTDAGFEELLKTRGVWDLPMEQVSPDALTLDGRALSLIDAINVYDDEIQRVDGLIAELLAALERKGVLDDTLVIITSDHGEGLGEHAYYSHGLYLYEEQVRVPLLVRPPARAGWEPVRVGRVVSLLDVVPTVLDLWGIDADPQLDGMSLREDRPERWLVLQRRWFPRDARVLPNERFDAGVPLSAIRGDGALKYHRGVDGTEELYDLSRDPRELANLARERPEEAASMARKLEELLHEQSAGVPVEQEVDPETRKKLKALGYVQ